MHLFVTGCNSFIGRALVHECDRQNIRVSGVDLTPSARTDCSITDICDAAIVEKIPEGVDAIVHLAALSRDSDCKDLAQKCFTTNVMGTLNLIDAAQRRNAKQFIFASSEWVYDTFEPNVAKTEESLIDATRLTSEYAFSKYVSEVNLRQKAQHGFMPVTILRFGIVYGPRTSNWSAVEALLNTVATKASVSVGSLETARRFIHVSDVATGVLAAVGQSRFEVINLQGNRMVTLGDVIMGAQRLLRRQVTVTETNPSSPSIRLVDNAKASKVLNWRPSVSLEDGLKSVALALGHLKI